ncbi:MAG: diguanylate cyclase [Gammaproteobacteria bacterium]|nr:diguanylate cyclase [Gammaproteobacteria bacterium]MDH3858337.1 diguanylate cyclase [Gammaproteobacteria bacterium]
MNDLSLPAETKNYPDTSELEAEVERLRHQELFLDATEQVAHIGHCEWDYETGSLKSCSNGYAGIFDQTVAEIMQSQNAWDLMLNTVHPEDRALYTQSYNSQGNAGAHDIEYRILRNDGEVRFIYEIGMVEKGDNGKISSSFCLLQDITERRIYEQMLENRDAIAQQVEAITDIGHFTYDPITATYADLSEGLARIHGATVDEYQSMVSSRADYIEDVYPEDQENLMETYSRHEEDGQNYSVEYRIHRSDGEMRWVREQGTALRSASGDVVQSIGVVQDITQQTQTERSLREARDSLEAMVKTRTRKLADTVKQLEGEIKEREKIAAELHFLANHDALTGLPSLRLCKDRLDQSLAEARRRGHMSAVMFLDLDGFKAINDEHGHEFGDLVLQATALRIKAEIRETDTVARIGGDEFIIILSSLPEFAIAERIAAGLIKQIVQPIRVEKVEVVVSASIGISIYPENGTTAEALIRAADKAMYQIKRQGKNNFGFFKDETSI